MPVFVVRAVVLDAIRPLLTVISPPRQRQRGSHRFRSITLRQSVWGVVVGTVVLGCQSNFDQPDSTRLENEVVEIACGECQFAMEGDSCDLAIWYQGKSYFVEGSDIDEHGDAHADDGLCNRIRSARVTGEIKRNRFQATRVELLP